MLPKQAVRVHALEKGFQFSPIFIFSSKHTLISRSQPGKSHYKMLGIVAVVFQTCICTTLQKGRAIEERENADIREDTDWEDHHPGGREQRHHHQPQVQNS